MVTALITFAGMIILANLREVLKDRGNLGKASEFRKEF